MNMLAQDLRYGIRGFARTPGFTVAAVLSLAIGIGANTAIFSVASALLLRPLPYKDADRLVILWNRSPGLGVTEDWFSTAQYFDIKTRHQGFEQVAIAIGSNYNLIGDGESERIGAVRVSSNLHPMLGSGRSHGDVARRMNCGSWSELLIWRLLLESRNLANRFRLYQLACPLQLRRGAPTVLTGLSVRVNLYHRDRHQPRAPVR